MKNGFPKLFNEKVSADRGILIHSGTTGKDSLAVCCLVLKFIRKMKKLFLFQEVLQNFMK